MSENEFTKLFKYMEQRFDGVDRRFDKVEAEIADIHAAIGELAAQVKSYHEEVLAMGRQLDKMREAILQIARETGVKLQVEL